MMLLVGEKPKKRLKPFWISKSAEPSVILSIRNMMQMISKDPADGNLNDSRVYARLWDMFYDMDAFANEYVFFMTKSKDRAWQG